MIAPAGGGTCSAATAACSTAEQSLALQQDALATAGCDRIFTDVASGATAARGGLTARGVRPLPITEHPFSDGRLTRPRRMSTERRGVGAARGRSLGRFEYAAA